MGVRIPSVMIIGVGTLFFLLYLLPWQNLPSVPFPSPSSLVRIRANNLHNLNTSTTVTLVESSSSFHQPQHRYKNNNDDDNMDPLLIIGDSQLSLNSPTPPPLPGLITYRAMVDSGVTFNPTASDVLVILHIQKTGGTSFEKHIVQDLVIEKPCVCWKKRKRCKCPRPPPIRDKNKQEQQPRTVADSWLFSRFSTGWICGLHADWTELTACVDTELDRAYGTPTQRRYFYATMIRDPIHRFLSEFRHVQRGATWKASRHICNGQYASPEEIGKCYSGRSWAGVSLSDFLNCSHNLAFNRQTRMLANLTQIGCYNRNYMLPQQRDKMMLASAKQNLVSMAFVGLTENQKISQYIFEETFNLRFKIPFTQNEDTYSKSTLDKTTPKELETVRQVNALDLELYAFAEQLLHNRFNELKVKDPDFKEHYTSLGEQNGYHFSWDDIENED